MNPKLLIIALTVLPLAAFIFQSMREGKKANSLLRYFQFGEKLPKTSFFATLAASNSGLGASVYIITVYGYFYGLGVLPWMIGFWISTQAASRLVIARVESITADSGGFIAKSGTLHEFLGFAFQNRSVRIAAGILSTLTYIGLIACEMLLSYEVVSAIVPKSSSFLGTRLDLTAFCITLAVTTLVAIYTSIAGFRAVIRTDKLQVALIIMMITSISFLAVFLGPTVYEKYTQTFPGLSWNAFFNPDGQGAGSFLIFFVGMNAIFWVWWWPAAMDQWHRCAASQQINTALDKKYGTFGWVSTVYFALLSLACITVGATVRILIQPSGGESAPLFYFLKYLVESPLIPQWTGAILIGLICAGLASAVVSTLDSYIVVALQSFLSDTQLASLENYTLAEADRNQRTCKKYLMSARKYAILIFVMAAVLSMLLAELSDVFTAIYTFFSFMMAPIPAITIALFNKARSKHARGILYSLIAGGIWAITTNAYIVYALEKALYLGETDTVTFLYNLLYANPTMTALIAFIAFFLCEAFYFLRSSVFVRLSTRRERLKLVVVVGLPRRNRARAVS